MARLLVGFPQYVRSCLLVLILVPFSVQARLFGISAATFQEEWAHRVTAAGIMACMHINDRNTILVKEVAELAPDFNLSCDVRWTETAHAAIQQTSEWVEAGVDAIIGPLSSHNAGPMTVVASSTRTPVISYGAESGSLSDKTLFPTFGRTIPSLDLKAKASGQLVVSLGWRNVAVLYGPGEVFVGHATALVEGLGAAGLQILALQTYDLDANGETEVNSFLAAMEEIARSGVRVIFIALGRRDIPTLVETSLDLGMVKGFQWINIGSSPVALPTFGFPDPEQALEYFHGHMLVNVAPFGGDEGDAAFQGVWRDVNQTRVWESMPPEVEPFDMLAGPDWRCFHTCGYMYDAVVAMALAVDRAEKALPPGAGRESVRQRAWAEAAGLGFRGTSGQVQFDSNMDRGGGALTFDMFMYEGVQRGGVPWLEPVRAGSFSLTDGLSIDAAADFPWSTGLRGWEHVLVDPATCAVGEAFSAKDLVCLPCPAGSVSSPGASACTLCPAGTVAPGPGSAVCTPCGATGYAEQQGMTACTPCAANHRIREEHVGPTNSSVLCECSAAYTMGCRVPVLSVVVVACAVPLAVALGSLIYTYSARRTVDAEQRLVQLRVRHLRRTLFLRRRDGFVVDREWGLGQNPTHIKGSMLEQLARLTLLLDFEAKMVDALTTILHFLGQDAVLVLDGDRIAYSVSALDPAPAAPDAPELSDQYVSLRHLLLETVTRLLDPDLPGSSSTPDKDVLAWARSPSASERFEYFRSKVATLGIWEDADNFLHLKGIAQLFMHPLRDALDECFKHMQGEDGADELLGLAGPEARDDDVAARQDHPAVEALPLTKSVHLDAELHSQLARSQAPRRRGFNQRSNSTETALSIDSVVDVPLETCSETSQAFGSRRTMRSFLREQGSGRSESAGMPPRVTSPLAALSLRGDAGSCSESPSFRRRSRRPRSLEGMGLGLLGSRWEQDEDLVDEYMKVHASLQAVASTLQLPSGVDAQLAATERPFIQWLRSRAEGLNKGFQDKVVDLCGDAARTLGDERPPLVFPGPVKSEQRMLEKTAVYRDEVEASGQDLSASLPLTALVLDPVRASLVCESPRQVVEYAKWLINSGEAHGLPVVKVKNKFAEQRASEHDGYRDIMVCVIYTGSLGLKIIGEIQVQEQRIHAIKMKMHRLYRVKRALIPAHI